MEEKQKSSPPFSTLTKPQRGKPVWLRGKLAFLANPYISLMVPDMGWALLSFNSRVYTCLHHHWNEKTASQPNNLSPWECYNQVYVIAFLKKHQSVWLPWKMGIFILHYYYYYCLFMQACFYLFLFPELFALLIFFIYLFMYRHMRREKQEWRGRRGAYKQADCFWRSKNKETVFLRKKPRKPEYRCVTQKCKITWNRIVHRIFAKGSVYTTL